MIAAQRGPASGASILTAASWWTRARPPVETLFAGTGNSPGSIVTEIVCSTRFGS